MSPCSLSACPVLITLHHELGSVYLLLLLVARKERSVAPYRDAGREFIKTSYLELVAQIPEGSGHRCSASSGLFHTPSEELFKDSPRCRHSRVGFSYSHRVWNLLPRALCLFLVIGKVTRALGLWSHWGLGLEREREQTFPSTELLQGDAIYMLSFSMR